MGLIALLLGVLLLVAGLVGYGWWRFNQITRLDLDEALAGPAAAGEPVNFLLVGSDRRDSVDRSDPDAAYLLGDGAPSGQRADTIMVLRLDPAGTGLDLLSVPRDLWVDLPEGGKGRINAAYVGGAQDLISVVGANLGIPIHHYVEIEFAAFRDLVDSVGGVPLWFDAPMRDAGSGLYIARPGCVRLDGTQALAFARSRKAQFSNGVDWVSDPTGDLGRITRQQVFLRRVADEVAGLNLADPRRIDDLLDIAVDNVSFDDRLGMGDLRDLAARFGSVGGDAMGLHTLPTEAFTTSGGAAVLRLLDEQARPVLDLFRDEPAPPTAGGDSAGDVPDLDAIPDVVVDVRNGTGAAGQAAALAADLEAVGFMSGTLGDAPDAPLAATRVAYHPDDLLAADRLARQLVTGAVLLADPAISPGRLVVTSGADFAGVSETPASVNPQGPPPTTTTSAPTTTRAPVTTTTVIGRSIGAVPPGETCG